MTELARLRQTLALVERPASAFRARLTFGCPALDEHLPGRGLSAGMLHELRPLSENERPQGISVALALAARIPKTGPILIVSGPKGLSPHAALSGHGMKALGLDPHRFLIARGTEEKTALWAIEEAARSRAPGAIIGLLGRPLDLKASQRLGAALQGSPLFMVLVTPPASQGATIAATRWAVAARPAGRDGHGLMARWRWHLRLERCRNGREGEWLVEWDHGAHRFLLAAAMADLALPEGGEALGSSA